MSESYWKRLPVALLAAVGFAALWLLLEALIGPAKAYADQRVRLHIYPHIPTVPGIEAAPSPAPFYQRGPVIRRAPSPGIFHMDPAPANGCGPYFEVTSGPRAGRGCYGIR